MRCWAFSCLPFVGPTATLLALYAKMTYGIHRKAVVELLIASNVLPAWLNKELPFDSYAGTQELHQSQP